MVTVTPLSASDLAALRHLRKDGGWTPDEARSALSDVEALTVQGLVTTLITDMGPVVLLLHRGALEAFGLRAPVVTADVAINRMYQRLCLRDLGWTLLRPAHEGRARDCDRLERYALVRAPEGEEGYLIAQLTRGGSSTTSLRKNLDWLKAVLIRERRMLFVMTPSTLRGDRFARENPSSVRVVRHCPNTISAERLNRAYHSRVRNEPHQGVAWGVPVDGPLVNSKNLRTFAREGYSDLTLEILSLARPDRIKRAQSAIRADRALSHQQLIRHYGLTSDDLPSVPYVEDVVVPVHGRMRDEVRTQFYLSSPRLGRLSGAQLAHLAGTAELRHQLGVDPHQWEVVVRGRPESEDPDAAWGEEDGAMEDLVAIEYDSGAYGLLKVQRKLEAFRDRGFKATVWGVPSETRARRLREVLGVETRVVKWFM